MKPALVLAALALVVPLGFTTSGAAQGGPTITFSVFRIYDSGNKIYRLRATGTISTRASGQYVSVMRQTCGYSFATAIAGAQTQAGGFFEAETRYAPQPAFDSSTYFARWGSAKSKPVTFRGRLVMNVTDLGKGRFQIYVSKGDALQDLRGRQVVVQRLNAGEWLRVAAARLQVDPNLPGGYVASFTVRTRGWTLRAMVPAKNARPCFNQSTSERFKS